MKHHSATRTLGRNRAQREALLRGLARDLFLRGGITTTVAKAKEVRPFAERLVTKARVDSVATRRLLSSELGNAPDVAKKLVEEIAPRYKERAGGYTRITKLGLLGARAAEVARIELV